MDTINSNWSGGQDSDDLSDDSSCGDQYQTLSQLHYTDPRYSMCCYALEVKISGKSWWGIWFGTIPAVVPTFSPCNSVIPT